MNASSVLGLVVTVGLLSVVQDPAPTVPTAPSAVLALAERCCRPGDAAAAAGAELGALVERDYAAVFAAWEHAAEGRERTCLERALSLPAVRAATTIVAGAIAKVETAQGGAIDYHRVDVFFAAPKVLRADPLDRDDLRAGYCSLLRGTHADAWLGEQLRPNLERVQGPRVFVFTAHRFDVAAGDGPARTIVVQQWVALPAAAAPCLQRLLR